MCRAGEIRKGKLMSNRANIHRDDDNCSSQVYGVGSEDMDTLTFGSPILLKHLTFSEARKMPVHEVDLKKALEGLNMEMDQVRAKIAEYDIWELILSFPSLSTCAYCWVAIIWTAFLA